METRLSSAVWALSWFYNNNFRARDIQITEVASDAFTDYFLHSHLISTKE